MGKCPRFLLGTFIWLLLLCLPVSAFGTDNVRLQLTAEERAWMEAHPVIRAINDKNYPPYDFYQNGKATGFSVEYLEKLAKMAGFNIQWDSRDEWNKAVSDFKYKKVDLLHAISLTEKRKAFTLFTTPYF